MTMVDHQSYKDSLCQILSLCVFVVIHSNKLQKGLRKALTFYAYKKLKKSIALLEFALRIIYAKNEVPGLKHVACWPRIDRQNDRERE